MKRRLLYAVVMLVLTIPLVACQVSAAESDGLSLEQALTWLFSPAAIGITLSVILEKVPFAKKYFDKITDRDWKRLAVLGFCMVVPVLALGVGSLLDYFELTADTVFNALAVGWDAFATSQVIHAFIREGK